MSALDDFIADLQRNQYSAQDQNLISKIETAVLALQFISQGLGPTGNQAANSVYAGPAIAPAAPPAFRALVAADIPALTPPSFSLPFLANSLGANVALNNTANYFDGPTVAQGAAGIWLCTGTVTVSDAVAASYVAKLWDGTTIIDSCNAVQGLAGGATTLSLSGVISAPAGNIKISVKDLSAVTGTIRADNSGNGKDSTLTVVRIG
jgi:hypothetical protein